MGSAHGAARVPSLRAECCAITMRAMPRVFTPRPAAAPQSRVSSDMFEKFKRFHKDATLKVGDRAPLRSGSAWEQAT